MFTINQIFIWNNSCYFFIEFIHYCVCINEDDQPDIKDLLRTQRARCEHQTQGGGEGDGEGANLLFGRKFAKMKWPNHRCECTHIVQCHPLLND